MGQLHIKFINTCTTCLSYQSLDAAVYLWGHNLHGDITKIQNNLIRCFLGANRTALIAALVGFMGWLLIALITKLSCL